MSLAGVQRQLAPNVTFSRSRPVASAFASNSQLGASRYFETPRPSQWQTADTTRGDGDDQSDEGTIEVMEIDLSAPVNELAKARQELFNRERDERRRQGRSPPRIFFPEEEQSQEPSQPDDIFANQLNNDGYQPPLEPVPEHTAALQQQLNDMWQYLSQIQQPLATNQPSRSVASSSSVADLLRDKRSERKELATYNGSESFRDWWLSLTHLRDQYHWTGSDMLVHAIAKLRGNALATYQSEKLSPSSSVERFKEVMEAICEQVVLDHTVHSRIRNSRMEPDEPVQRFIANMSSLFNMLKEKMSEDAKISALLDGVVAKFDPTTCQSARLQGDFAKAARYLVEVEGYMEQRAQYFSNSRNQTMRFDKKQTSIRSIPLATSNSTATTTPAIPKEGLLYCAKHGEQTDHSAETCNLQWCDHHGWKSHVTRDCRTASSSSKRKLATATQGNPQASRSSPYFQVKQLKSGKKKNLRFNPNQQFVTNPVNQVNLATSPDPKNFQAPQN